MIHEHLLVSLLNLIFNTEKINTIFYHLRGCSILECDPKIAGPYSVRSLLISGLHMDNMKILALFAFVFQGKLCTTLYMGVHIWHLIQKWRGKIWSVVWREKFVTLYLGESGTEMVQQFFLLRADEYDDDVVLVRFGMTLSWVEWTNRRAKFVTLYLGESGTEMVQQFFLLRADEYDDDVVLVRFGMTLSWVEWTDRLWTDALLALLKKALQMRDDLQAVIITSVGEFRKFKLYFNAFSVTYNRIYETEESLEENCITNYYDATSNKFEELLDATCGTGGNIVVFLPCKSDVEMMYEDFVKKLPKINVSLQLRGKRMSSVELFRLHSSLSTPPKMYKSAPSSDGCVVRKVLFATHIAETSFSIEGVQYVMDSGYTEIQIYDLYLMLGVEYVMKTRISMIICVRRTSLGGSFDKPLKCYRMYTEDVWKALEQLISPPFGRCKLHCVVCLLKKVLDEDVQKFQFIKPPDSANLESSISDLTKLGALDASGQLTELGYKICKFPLEPAVAINLHPSSSLEQKPSYVMFSNYVPTATRDFIQIVSDIDPDWIQNVHLLDSHICWSPPVCYFLTSYCFCLDSVILRFVLDPYLYDYYEACSKKLEEILRECNGIGGNIVLFVLCIVVKSESNCKAQRPKKSL
ncbi:DEXH box helicase [Artemisia annua]|uniref:RNA helicase n=1 Tax=Artemisia annua TaxID=35608 RepID=A0A2U1LYA8_ARTAN|nr:DEXH box helicase [Artemisia annua]